MNLKCCFHEYEGLPYVGIKYPILVGNIRITHHAVIMEKNARTIYQRSHAYAQLLVEGIGI